MKNCPCENWSAFLRPILKFLWHALWDYVGVHCAAMGILSGVIALQRARDGLGSTFPALAALLLVSLGSALVVWNWKASR